MKKRIFSILMVVVMTIALVACGTAQSSPDSEAVETVKEVVESADAENSEAVSETEQATEAPVDEVVETVDETVESESSEATSETESDEVASTPDSEAVESEASEPDSEAVVEPEFTVTEVTATKYATQSVNVRSGPSTDYDKIGGLTTNQEVQVTGQASTGWYRFTWTDGREAYVSDKYLSDEKIEKPAASETPSNGGNSTAGTGSAASNACPYALWQPIDNWDTISWYVTQPDPNWETSGHKETQAWMQQTILDRFGDEKWQPGYTVYAEQVTWQYIGHYAEGDVYLQGFAIGLWPN